MPLFAGRKVLYSLDRGDVKSALLRPCLLYTSDAADE